MTIEEQLERYFAKITTGEFIDPAIPHELIQSLLALIKQQNEALNVAKSHVPKNIRTYQLKENGVALSLVGTPHPSYVKIDEALRQAEGVMRVVNSMERKQSCSSPAAGS